MGKIIVPQQDRTNYLYTLTKKKRKTKENPLVANSKTQLPQEKQKKNITMTHSHPPAPQSPSCNAMYSIYLIYLLSVVSFPLVCKPFEK